MSIPEDIREKIAEAANNLADQNKRLAEFEELEKALGKANQGLGQAAEEISKLAASGRLSQESLATTVKAFNEATSALMELKPAPSSQL